MALASGMRLGPYEVTSLLGEGGMGQVYRARDTNLNRDVALKILPGAFGADLDRLARMRREAQVLASLNHPNIAAIYGFEDSGATHALVMELVEGPTLADRIAQGPMPLDEALAVARQIAAALAAAHEQGVVHRDLKPANVKVRADGAVKVLDFGLAKAMEPAGALPQALSMSPTIATPAMTMAGVILGTAAYMSPEQARGREVDKRSDIWAFGCVLFEMLTGRQLFQGGDLTEILASIVKDQPDLSVVPPQVRRLLARCLEKDPGKRLRDLGDAWDLVDDGATTTAAAAGARPSRRSWPALLGVGVAAAALAFLGGWLIFGRRAPASLPVQRLTLALPANGNLIGLAISPDGRSLAMAVSVDGVQRLWLRPLDAFEARPVPASDGAGYPFWSPDSRFVAFFADGKLKKAAVAGGPPAVVCDAPSGRGGSWNRDGVIVFSPIPTAIQRVAATGGMPAAVTTKVAGTKRFPVFLPDGRRFLYLASQSPQDSGIYLGSLDGKGEDVRLLPDVSSFSIAAGRLVFVRDGTLLAQDLDLGTGRLAGEAVSIADGVPFITAANYAPVTISESGALVYGGAGLGSLAVTQLTWFDRDGKLLGTVGAPGPIRDPSLSPDGKAVAFTRTPQSSPSVWVRALDRDVEQQVDADPAIRAVEPVWSPRGDRILFNSRNRLAEKRADGSGMAQVLTEDVGSSPSDWSRDGRYVVFTRQLDKSGFDVWLLPRDSAPQKPMPFVQTAASEHYGRLSPDGRWLAYASNESGRDEVYVRPFPSGDGRWQISSGGGTEPRWRGDGKELFFIAADRSMMAAPVSPDATGSRPALRPGASRRLFDTRSVPINSFAWRYDVAADGKRFLLASPVEASTAAQTLNVVVNWDAGLKK